MRQIEIDLDVHKAIESLRMSFAETDNEILRRALVGSDRPRDSAGAFAERSSRSRGNYSLGLYGEEIAAGSLKEMLKKVILAVEAKEPGFVEKLGEHRTKRGRRIVARTREEVYPGRTELYKYAERLNPQWWFDTNISFHTTERYLGVLADKAKTGPLKLRQG